MYENTLALDHIASLSVAVAKTVFNSVDAITVSSISITDSTDLTTSMSRSLEATSVVLDSVPSFDATAVASCWRVASITAFAFSSHDASA